MSRKSRFRAWLPLLAFAVAGPGCDAPYAPEPASPVVAIDSEAAQKARAQDQALAETRKREEAKFRARAARRHLDLPVDE